MHENSKNEMLGVQEVGVGCAENKKEEVGLKEATGPNRVGLLGRVRSI